jgi:predicted lactoylglutathione lyase
VSLVTLGVANLDRSTRFYQALGWPLSPASVSGEVSFFDTEGAILAVYGRDALAADARVTAGAQGGFSGVALAVNLETPADVDALIEKAIAAGAKVTSPASVTEWGGYTGYFTDPDGHLWEVAHNPAWPIGPDGRPQLPKTLLW